jgi:hypothetical protein
MNNCLHNYRKLAVWTAGVKPEYSIFLHVVKSKKAIFLILAELLLLLLLKCFFFVLFYNLK